MARLIGQTLLRTVLVIVFVSIFVFLLIDLFPGDPAITILGQDKATPEAIAQLTEELGLDDPFPVRYLSWLGDVITGDLGKSYRIQGKQVSDILTERLPVTLQLAIVAQIVALAIAVPLGVLAAYRAGRPTDKVLNAASFAAISMPQFLVGILLVYLFFNKLGWLPPNQWVRLTSGDLWGHLERLILPVTALALSEIAVYQRLLRSDMLSTLQEDYILSAKAKGLSARRVLFRHALRPSSFSLITLAGVSTGRLLGGTVVVEYLFNLPGLGTALRDAVTTQDVMVLQALVLFVATAYVVINVVVDLSYAFLDPRVRNS